MAVIEQATPPGTDPGTPTTSLSRVASSSGGLLPGYLVALVLVFVGERIATSDATRSVCSGLGCMAALGITLQRFRLAGRSEGERRSAERALALASAGGLLALLLYFTTTDKAKALLGIAAAAPETRARIEGALLVAWVALLVVSVLPLVLGELALSPMRRAALIEARRVRAALTAGLTLAFALVYCGLFTYAAGELDLKADFSFFRTARPSESTKKVAASSSDPIEVKAFFPQLNEVGTEALGYLRELAAAAPGIFKVEEHDRLLVPQLAKEAKVNSDGVVVLSRGASRETLFLGTEMKSAANKLKTLDGDFQKALLKVLRDARIAYLTIGHGELNDSRTEGTAEGHTGTAEGHTAKGIRRMLESQNYTVKDLGLSQGLGTEIPADATVVLVLGPSQPLLAEEVASLKRYAQRGGHLLLALDPEPKVNLAPLAELVGLNWNPAPLAQDRALVARRHNKSDRGILVSNRFSSHASISTLSRNAGRAPVLFPGASSLDKKDDSSDFTIDFAIKALPETFEDQDRDFEFQMTERRMPWNLVAAVSKKVAAPAGSKDTPELRAFVLADVDCLSDLAFGHEPNIFLAADALRWLGGEESFAGAITNTEDVRIEHTRQKDVIWFYATILGAPSAMLGLGLWLGRKPQRKKPTKTAIPTGPKPEEKRA